jgi:serine/threonine-protein kinase
MVFGRRYRVTEKIGTGGMAEVYKAVDEVLGRTVAVKVMHPRYAADPGYAARFRQEAQAAANLQSPYIVNIYDWGQDGDTYYIVMELVRGTDLKSIIETKGAVDSRRVAEIGAQVCSALSVAHGYDVIHRDIKPHNIMVTPEGAAKVMDFGIARAGNTTMTQTGSVLGTAHYVSPEQAQGRPLTAASDLYSLGIVLFEAATGELPFDADSPVAVALKQVNEAAPLPRQVNPNIDPGLEAVIVTTMAKDPAARYDTAEEMRRDLLRVVQGREVATTPAVPVAIGEDPSQRTSVMPQVNGDPYPQDGRVAARRPIPRKRPIWPWILLAALLVVAGLAMAWQMELFGAARVPVPSVVGLSLEDAEAALTEVGLKRGEVTEVNDKTVPAGQVISQSPIALFPAEEGSEVDLTVSSGPKQVTVPELVGLPKDEAETALTDLGFTPKIDYESSGNVPLDQVISQQPEPGEEVDEGSTVAFVVSRGPNVVTVPDVVGKKRAAAEKSLRDAKFKVSRTEQFSESIASGVVISQSPNKGFEGTEGSTVSIVVSKGPERSTVPDLVGKTEAQARDLIKKAKLEAQVTYFVTENSGKVVEQLPATGTKVPPGSVVEILIDGESGQADE